MAAAGASGITATANNTSHFIPSSDDFFMGIPRLAQRLGSFAFVYVPEQLDNIFGKIGGGSIIAEPTNTSTFNNATSITSMGGAFVQGSLGAGSSPSASAAANMADNAGGGILNYQRLRGIFGFFGYLTSGWALATFLASVLLNRTQFFASTRIPLRLNWLTRLFVYIVPTLVLLTQIQSLLQAMRCQTSPDWWEMRYGNADKRYSMDFAGEGGMLYRLSSSLLFWQDDETACLAVGMVPNDDSSSPARFSGSLSLLWSLFLSLILSHFVEALSCALQGRQPLPEYGMTIFEHSLAFAEAESMVMKPFDQPGGSSITIADSDGEKFRLDRTDIMKIINVPPEVLLISLISSFSHLSSNLLAVAGWRSRFRLVNTGIWGLAYMGTFLWSFIRMTASLRSNPIDLWLVRFPTVCIVGFIPHMLILIGITACGIIYGIALLLCAASIPPNRDGSPMSLRERFSKAYDNLQANVHLSNSTPVRINWQDDFYTTLLKVGFAILTAASQAVFLNEGPQIRVSQLTWLEEKRLQEIMQQRQDMAHSSTSSRNLWADGQTPGFAQGLQMVDHTGDSHDTVLRLRGGGYGRERRARVTTGGPQVAAAPGQGDTVGVEQRRSRFTMSFEFIRGTYWLLVKLYVKLFVLLLRKVGFEVPEWFSNLAGPTRRPGSEKRAHAASDDETNLANLDFWMISDEGQLTTPSDLQVDVEAERRRQLECTGQLEQDDPEEKEAFLHNNLYDWWKNGGWWGEVDNSGSYQAVEQDDDTTSVISTVTEVTSPSNHYDGDRDWVSESEDGRRTPTQRDYMTSRYLTPEPENVLDTTRLAALLDPQNKEEQEEARVLSRHIAHQGVLTRSKYRSAVERDRARVLLSSTHDMVNGPMTPEEEERALERYILERRMPHFNPMANAGEGSWESGAEGMGSGGPQCVVCQLSPRTVLSWPCGCLSLCDECRLGLATRNFTACVCCRTEVVAYSKLFVP